MRYYDQMYGEWELPEILEQLMTTDLVTRMRGISMSAMPNEFLSFGCFPSRFHHGMGVARLMAEVIQANQHLSTHAQNLLLTAALLHDAGNTPFSHALESKLKVVYPDKNYNGESFLLELLPGSETEQVLREFEISTQELMGMILGKTELAKVLHGTMDVDNIDNIARYAHGANLRELHLPVYRPITIAQQFRWHEGQWALHGRSSYEDIKNWQRTRAAVYGKFVYAEEYFASHIMLGRALDLAEEHGLLTPGFFRKTDGEALDAFSMSAVPGLRVLINDMRQWKWFLFADGCTTETPNEAHHQYAGSSDMRKALRRELALAAGTSEDYFGIHIGAGRDTRKVELPILHEGKLEKDSEIDPPKTYRARLYVSPKLQEAQRRALVMLFRERLRITR